MKIVFAEPTHSYTIVLDKYDIAKLITGGVIYQPLHTPNTRRITLDSTINSDGHFLEFYGSRNQDEGSHIQFVNIRLERDEE